MKLFFDANASNIAIILSRNGGDEINSLPELMKLAGGRTQLLENMLRGSLNSQQINQVSLIAFTYNNIPDADNSSSSH